jgi:lipopolysaccharide exporter
VTLSKAKTFRNILYTSLTKGTTLVCLAVTTSVIARNLTPADYGVVGFAAIIIGFLGNFADVGVANSAIRRTTLDQEGLRSAFTLKVILSLAAFGAAFLIAPFAHHFFQHPATDNVVRVLALDFLVSTVGFMPLVVLTRDQNFRTLSFPGVAGAVVRCILTVVLILLGWRYWAVVVADVGATFGAGVILQLARRIPIRLHFGWEDMAEYLRFGIPLFAAGVLVFVIFNLDNFLVGARLGSTQLGYYALAFAWGSFVCRLLFDTVNSVLFPAFSAIQNDVIAMRRWYLKTIDLVGFVAVAVNTALLANTHWFLVTFLGKGTDKWIPAEGALRILCLYGILRAIVEPVSSCVMAIGKTKTLLQSNAVAGIVEVLLLLPALRTRSISLVAVSVSVAYATQILIYVPFLRRNLGIGFRDVARQLWPVIPAIIGGCLLTSLLPTSLGSTFLTLACKGLFTALTVAVIHGLCTRFRCFHEAGGMISHQFARVRA